MSSNDRENGKTVTEILKNGLVSLGVSYAVCAALAVLCTGFAMMTEHPRSMAFLGKVIFFAGCALCGFICGKKTGKMGFLCGLFSGGVYCLLTILLSAVCIPGDEINLLIPLSGILVSIAASCVVCMGKAPKNSAPTGIKQKKAVRYTGGYNK